MDMDMAGHKTLLSMAIFPAVAHVLFSVLFDSRPRLVRFQSRALKAYWCMRPISLAL